MKEKKKKKKVEEKKIEERKPARELVTQERMYMREIIKTLVDTSRERGNERIPSLLLKMSISPLCTVIRELEQAGANAVIK